MQSKLSTAFHDLVRWFQTSEVDYAIIGGLAVAARGFVRVTADVDAVVARDVDDVGELLDQVRAGDSGAAAFAERFADSDVFARQGFLLPLIHRSTAIHIDISLGLSGFEHTAVQRASTLELDGTSASFLSAEDLILFKLIACRPQDLQDIDGIVAANQDTLDWGYCIATAEAIDAEAGLTLASQLEQLREAGR